MRRWIVALPCLLTMTACHGLEDGAKEEFSKQHTCPPPRVQSRERTDVDIYDLEHPGRASPTPPAEVAADPERLAMWQQARAAKEERDRAIDKSYYHLFEVRGCSHTVLYKCKKPGRGSTPGLYYSCSPVRFGYPPGTPAW